MVFLGSVMKQSIFLNKRFWDSVNSQLLDKVQNESVFKSGKKGKVLSCADAFEDCTDTYLPDLIRTHMTDYLPAEGVHDLHDSSFYDRAGNFIGINTKGWRVGTPVMSGCKVKRLYDYLAESESHNYVFLSYDCVEQRGRVFIKKVEALPITLIPIDNFSFTGGGWGSLIVRRYIPREQKFLADGTRDMRGRWREQHGIKTVSEWGPQWDNPLPRAEWLEQLRIWIVKSFKHRQKSWGKKIAYFERM
jgi:hypothetical protein